MHQAMTAQLSPDNLRHLKARGQKANIKALKNAVERLCLAATQITAGQRKDDTADKSVNWQSPEIDLCQYVILCEAVALVLSGRLDELESGDTE